MDYYTADTRALSSMAQTCRNVTVATNPYLVSRLRTRRLLLNSPMHPHGIPAHNHVPDPRHSMFVLTHTELSQSDTVRESSAA